MTEKKKRFSPSKLLDDVRPPLYITAGKSRGSMTVALVGIDSIAELSPECIELTTKAGRVRLTGIELRLSIFEQRTVEVTGRIEEVSFGYGKA